MKKLGILLFLVALSPSLVSAQSANLSTSTAELQTQIQELLKQVQTLQQQVTALKVELGQQEETAPAVPPELARSLYRGSTGDDVRAIQEFLSQDKEIYPEGLVTGYFGPLTEGAVKRWQEKHGVESVGIIGPKTIAKFNEFRDQTATPAIPAQPIGLTGTTTIPAIPAQPATAAASTRPRPESCAASYNYCVGSTECSANGWYWCRNGCYGSVGACLGQTFVPPAVPATPAQPATQTTQPATPAVPATTTTTTTATTTTTTTAATTSSAPLVSFPPAEGAPATSPSSMGVSAKGVVTWSDDQTNETRFEIYRSPSGNAGTWARVGSVGSNATSYNDIVTSAGYYAYYVLACNGFGCSPYKGFIGINITSPYDTSPPIISSGFPSGVLPSGTASTTLSVATDRYATCRYALYPNVSFAFMLYANTFSTTGDWGGTAHSKVITGLTNGTSYNYYVRCQGATGTNNTTDYIISFSVANPTAPTLSQVQGLTAAVSGSSVVLSWQPVPEWNGGPTTGGYNIYRGSSADFTPSLTYPTDNHIAQGNVLSYTDSNLSPGTYYYKVAYQNNSGTVGPASTAASAVVSAPPPSSAPSIKTGTGVVGDSKTFSFGTGTIEYSMGGAGVSGYIYSGSPGSAGRTSPILSFANPTASDTTSCGPYPSSHGYQGITNICQFTSAANYAFSSAEDSVRIYDKSSPCYQGILLFKQNNLYGGIDLEDVDSSGALHYRYWYDESGGSNFSSLCQTSLSIPSLQKTASVLNALAGILRQIQELLR